jgi:hypothetical protein
MPDAPMGAVAEEFWDRIRAVNLAIKGMSAREYRQGYQEGTVKTAEGVLLTAATASTQSP